MSSFVVSRLADGRIFVAGSLPQLPRRRRRIGGPAVKLPTGAHRKMLIIVESGVVFRVPFAPRETSLAGAGAVFSTVDRPGRKPLVIRSSTGLLKMSMELMIGEWDAQTSIERTLLQLQGFAGSGQRMRVVLDATSARTLWRMTEFSQQVTMRQHGTNAATRATCTVEFTEAVDAVVHVGPVSGGAKPAAAAPPRPSPPRVHVVVRGDTLWAIARKFYGNGALYPRIADANRVRNPNLIYPGQRFLVP